MIPISALRLAGFVLAHAAWSVSDAPEDELLTPLMVVEQAGNRELIRFEADTQEGAVNEGRRAAAEHSETADAWAFAREGTVRLGNGDPQDVLVVEFWSKGMQEPITLIQPFERYTVSRRFRILGEPLVTRGGQVIESPELERITNGIMEGIQGHSKVRDLWSSWL